MNRDLDSFYEFLYAQCNSVTEADYKAIGEQLCSMLATLKMLWLSCKKMPKSCGISDEDEKLKMNYSALYELNEDIKNSRIKAPKDEEWSALLAQASLALKWKLHDLNKCIKKRTLDDNKSLFPWRFRGKCVTSQRLKV